MSKSSSIEDFNLLSNFEAVRQTLLEDRFSDRLGKPLGYWVLPNDRRLPLAFLHRTLDELLSTPFDELSATPGIGQKKISSLVKLLQRATKDEPPGVPAGLPDSWDPSGLADKQTKPDSFDPSIVSEALWTEWCALVREFNIGHERLGRLAPSLKKVPTVIWHTPMSDYLDQSVTNIRRLRTHGEKRVRCVLEVFHSVYSKLSNLQSGSNVQAILTPARIAQAQKWVMAQNATPAIPSDDEIRREFAIPLLEQLRIDSGDTVYSLAEQRLGISGTPQSVRDQSRSLGVTRARVYQLLDDCSKVMQVRWPEGKAHLDALTTKFAGTGHEGQHLALFYGLRELCYPEKLKSGAPAALAIDQAPRLDQQAAIPGYQAAPLRDNSADTVPMNPNQAAPNQSAPNQSAPNVRPSIQPAAPNAQETIRIDPAATQPNSPHRTTDNNGSPKGPGFTM